MQALQAALVGKPHSRAGVKAAVAEVRALHPGQDRELDELESWLMAQVEVQVRR